MTFSQPPRPEQKDVHSSYQQIQSEGEDLGYQITPKELDYEPTPTDLLEAAASYAQGALGSGSEVRDFRKVSTEPEIWQGTVVNAGQTGVLTARRVPGGYDLKVESGVVQGIYD